ncbi:MAG: replication-relaxation family protein [Thermoanaerobaculia bacterium]
MLPHPDPRSVATLTERDHSALKFIGETLEAAQYQVATAVFPHVSEVVVSRRVRRLHGLGLIAIERWNKVGINRIRLTAQGADLLVTRRIARADELFLSRAPLSPRAVPHHLWVTDCRLVLERLPHPPDRVLSAWALERQFVPRLPAIPDVLAITSPGPDHPGLLLAVEVDLGGEPIRSVLVPKLRLLQSVLAALAGTSPAAVCVLTVGARRAEALRRAVSDLPVDVLVTVDLLPSAAGRPALTELTRLFTAGVETS